MKSSLHRIVCLGLFGSLLVGPVGCSKDKAAGSEKESSGAGGKEKDKARPTRDPGPRARPPAAGPARAGRPAEPVARARPTVVARKMDRSAFKATVKRLSYPELYRLLKDPRLSDLTGWGLKNSIGGTRFLGVVRGTQKRKVGNAYEFKLAAIDKQSGKWKLVWKLDLKTSEPSFYPPTFTGAASLFVDDYDWDGKPEALVRYRYTTKPERAVGWTELTDLMIVNVDENKPRIAFFINFNRNPQAEVLQTVKSRLKHKDLNGDGHPDLVITRRIKQQVQKGDEFVPKRTVETLKYLWDPATDTYKAAPRKPGSGAGK